MQSGRHGSGCGDLRGFDAEEAQRELDRRVAAARTRLDEWNKLPESGRKGKKQTTVLYQVERSWTGQRAVGPAIPVKDDFMMMLQKALGHARRTPTHHPV